MDAITLKYLPIPSEIAADARRDGVDRFGHALVRQKAKAPCRHCLRIPASEEDLLLLSYQPLPDRNPYAEIGPIFVHERECASYESVHSFPVDFVERELVIRAYDARGHIFDAIVAASREGERVAAEFLNNPTVEEIHVRHPSYTCFFFKIARA